MNILTALFLVALAAQEGPAPEDVKAGWLGLVVWLGLALAVVFLGFSLRKHLKKVDFEEDPDRPDAESRPGDGATQS